MHDGTRGHACAPVFTVVHRNLIFPELPVPLIILYILKVNQNVIIYCIFILAKEKPFHLLTEGN